MTKQRRPLNTVAEKGMKEPVQLLFRVDPPLGLPKQVQLLVLGPVALSRYVRIGLPCSEEIRRKSNGELRFQPSPFDEFRHRETANHLFQAEL
jgi:hypothetical protein